MDKTLLSGNQEMEDGVFMLPGDNDENYSDFVIINLSFSTVSEWVMALSLDLSILSLVPEFKLLTFAEPKIIVNIEPRGFMNIDQDHQEDNSTDYYSQSNSSMSLLA